MKIVFATNNLHKLEEIRQLTGHSVRILGLDDIGCQDDIPEPFATLEENAAAKVKYIYQKFKTDCFADDTGLEVEALHGAPGVHSARFAGEEKDSAANVKKLLSLLQGIENRKARFRTVIAYMEQGKIRFFEGTVNGIILDKPKGTMGFGYDPVFQPDGYSCSFAEMSLLEKNRISHRARAMNAFSAYLKNGKNEG